MGKNEPMTGTQKNLEIIEKRGCRDIICCLIYIIFNGAMVYLAINGFTKGDILKLTTTFDSEGNACGVTDGLKDYPYAYFGVPHFDYLNKTMCVKKCPTYIPKVEQRPRKLDAYDTFTTQSLTDLWTEKDDVQFEQNIVVFGTKTFSDKVQNPATNFAKWHLLYSTTYNLVYGKKEAFGSYYSFSLGWTKEGFPNHMPIVYPTTTFLGRFCMPSAAALKEMESVKGLLDLLNVQLVVDTATEWINDMKNAQWIIMGSVAIALVLGFFYMLFIYLFAGIIVWLVILLYFILVGLIAYYCYYKYNNIKDSMDFNEKHGQPRESGSNTETTLKIFTYLFYGLVATWIISFLILLCMFNNIRKAIAIVKTACVAVKDMPLMLFIPIIFTILIFIHLIWWLISFGYVYSVGKIQKSPQGPWAQVKHDENYKYAIWYYVFGGLWNNAFIGALNEFIIASCVAIWYFSGGGTDKKELHKPISRSIYRAFRYHMGSLAFGSFLLALIQFIRILLLCCMAYLERVIKFLTRQAYIEMAIKGKSFLNSAKESMRLIFSNFGIVALLQGIGGVFRFLGKAFISIATVYICYYIMDNYEPWKSELSSPILPLIIIFVFAYIVGVIFLSIYGMAIDTILLCFLHSKEIEKSDPSYTVKVPSQLQTFMEKQSDQKK